MLNDQNNLYVTLPSNGSKKTFPSNRANSYKNQLARELRLDGDWEVALTEVHYPQTMKSIEKVAKLTLVVYRFEDNGTYKAKTIVGDAARVEIPVPMQYGIGTLNLLAAKNKLNRTAESADVITIEFPVAKYTTPQVVIDLVRKSLAKSISELTTHSRTPLETMLEFDFDSSRNRFYINPTYPYLELYYYGADDAARMLGLSTEVSRQYNSVHLDKYFLFPAAPQLNRVNSLYIYTDVIENDIVGDALVPLLRTVNVSGDPGVIVHEVFHRCYYKRVNRSNIPLIEIQINSETGDPVKFESGHVICVLNFRRVNR